MPAASSCASVVALHRVDVGLDVNAVGLYAARNALFFGLSSVVGVVQRRQEAFAPTSPCASSVPSVRKPGPYSGILSLRPGRGVVLDELHRAAAREERVDRVRLERGDLGQERLELDLRERERQLLDDLAAASLRTLP